MRILIFGATGMLGQALVKVGRERNFETIGVARSRADICLDIRDISLLDNLLEREKPEIVINAAANVSLVDCENNPANAYEVNSRPAAVLADLCRRNGSYFIQISTDHYYKGDGALKHRENDRVVLLNEYARTKFAAESFALTYKHALVLRTNIIGFRRIPSQPTFVEWVFQMLQNQLPMKLFADYYTSSIDVGQFSEALFDLIDRYPVGILNLASREVISKEMFIRKIAAKLDYSLNNAEIGSVHDDIRVKRADSSGLDVSKAELLLNRRLPTLDEVVNRLISEYSGGVSV